MSSLSKRFTTAELILTAIGCLALALAVAALLYDGGPGDVSEADAVAVVTVVHNDARSKFENSLQWFNNRPGGRLSEGTAVFSGRNSRIELRLKNGSVLKLAENTLIVLRADAGMEVEISFGSLESVVPAGQQLKLRSGRHVRVIPGSQRTVQIRKVDEHVEIQGEPVPRQVAQVAAPVPAPAPEPEPVIVEEPPVAAVTTPRPPKPRRRIAAAVAPPAPAPELPAEEPQEAPFEYQPPPKLAAPALLKKPKGPPRHFLSVSGGMNHLSFAQAGVEVKSLNYASVEGPSYSLHAKRKIGERFAIEGAYSSHPGKIKSAQIEVVDSSFNWNFLSLEGMFAARPGMNLRLGMQRHTLPYVQVVTLSQVSVRDYTQQMATVGADYSWQIRPKWSPQVLFRYQLPVSYSEKNGDDLRPKVRFAFDGSAGINRTLSKDLNLGMFWYGQWHEYDYSMFNSSTGLYDYGQSSYFFSSLELRFELGF